MDNLKNEKSISETVLDEIKRGDIKMKPKIYFILRVFLLVLGIIAVSAFILYLISFIVFSLRVSGVWFLPGLGMLGVKLFLFSLPWLLIIISLLLIIILEILARYFKFVYQRPIIYSVLAIIIIIVLATFVIGKTQLHSGLMGRAQQGCLPLMGKFYRDYGVLKSQNMHKGIVLEIIGSGFIIEANRGRILKVIISSDTYLSKKEIEKGDKIMVIGLVEDDIIKAEKVLIIPTKINAPLPFKKIKSVI